MVMAQREVADTMREVWDVAAIPPHLLHYGLWAARAGLWLVLTVAWKAA